MNNKLFYFIKAGQPRIWFSSTGQLLHWESPGTSRARELADVYRLLDCEEDLEGNDRMPALEALKNMVKFIYSQKATKLGKISTAPVDLTI